MDDILDMLDGNDKPFKDKQKTADAKEENLYNSEDIKAIKIDTDSFVKKKKYFTIITYNNKEDLPENVIEKLTSIAKVMFSNGYTLRTTGEKVDPVLSSILKLENHRVETYLPWKPKKDEKVDNVTMYKPNKIGYGIAMNSHKIFMKLHPAVRAILAARVHTILGPSGTEPCRAVIAYSSTGSEGYKKGMDFKKEGDLTFYFKVCGDSNIPIFNIKNDDSIVRLSSLIKED